MYRLLARRRARVRASALRIGSMDKSRLVACPNQGADSSPAQLPYQIDYATWYARLSAAGDKPSADRAANDSADATRSLGLRDSIIPEAEAA
jgi:hypothetical protein